MPDTPAPSTTPPAAEPSHPGLLDAMAAGGAGAHRHPGVGAGSTHTRA